MDKSFFFIAILPPSPIYEEIKSYQKIVSEQFDSHKSLKHIPHITLVPPFHILSSNELDLSSMLQNFKSELTSFEITINGFSHFKKHTLFVNVMTSSEIERLHKKLLEALNDSDLLNKPIHYFQQYNPHITIGYRDLEPHFKPAWNYFEPLPYQRGFVCTEFVLLKHNGAFWEMIECFELSKVN